MNTKYLVTEFSHYNIDGCNISMAHYFKSLTLAGWAREKKYTMPSDITMIKSVPSVARGPLSRYTYDKLHNTGLNIVLKERAREKIRRSVGAAFC